MQVGVWIPKAKMGPEADNFRPLGMPNTLDRLVDGTIASVVMKAVAPNMHPSQTVMSMFKEPGKSSYSNPELSWTVPKPLVLCSLTSPKPLNVLTLTGS